MEPNDTLTGEGTNEGSQVDATATAVAGPRTMTDEAKAKQADTMKERWQDPIYKANVAKGRYSKKIEKLQAEISVSTDQAVTDKLNVELVAAQAKLAEADAVLASVATA